MIIGVALLAISQASAWVSSPPVVTVGDTIRIELTIPTPPGTRARVRPLGSSEVLQPLDDPVTLGSDSSITVRYVLALFEPGEHGVTMPDIELLRPDGTVETVLGDVAIVQVASVLPQSDSLPPPKLSQPPIARSATRLLPLLLLAVGASVITGAWGVMRRRKGPDVTGSAGEEERVGPPLTRWIGAGEPRAVAAVVAESLRRKIAEIKPQATCSLSTEECIQVLEAESSDLPVREIGELLRSLERARFAPAVASDVMELTQQTEALVSSLDRPPEAEG